MTAKLNYAGVVGVLFGLAGASLSAEEPSSSDRRTGSALLASGRIDDAKAAFLAQAQSDSNDAEARWHLGRIALARQQSLEAVRWFEEAVRIKPANSTYHHGLGQAYGREADRHRNLTVFGLVRKTRQSFEKAIGLDPANLRARLDLAQFYVEAPGFLGGDYKLALSQVEAIRKVDPYLGAIARGVVLESRSQWSEAEQAFQSALKLDPSKLEAYYDLGELYLAMKRPEDALGMFQKVLQKEPSEMKARFRIGQTALLSGQHLQLAETMLKEYLEATPSLDLPSVPDARVLLGKVYVKRGELEKARLEFQAALKFQADHAEAVKELTKLPAKAGRN